MKPIWNINYYYSSYTEMTERKSKRRGNFYWYNPVKQKHGQIKSMWRSAYPHRASHYADKNYEITVLNFYLFKQLVIISMGWLIWPKNIWDDHNQTIGSAMPCFIIYPNSRGLHANKKDDFTCNCIFFYSTINHDFTCNCILYSSSPLSLYHVWWISTF